MKNNKNGILPKNMRMLRVNAARLKSDFNILSEIGATPQGGVNRPALSEAHLAAREWFKQRIISAGLEFHMDRAGNHSAYLPCGHPNAPALLLGSHLDSVPDGGKYDGALGVLAALETLRVIQENRLSLPVNLEAIDFTDEEGTLVGILGSAALVGILSRETLQNPRCGRQEFLLALERAGLGEDGLLDAARDPSSITDYIELHIEQGPRLSNSGTDIGIVTAIVGISSYKLTFLGRADHAGTTPIKERLDASQGASAFTLAVRELILNDFPQCVANVGNMCFSPGAFNIVPEQVEVSLEMRSGHAEVLEKLETAMLQRALIEAKRFGLELRVEQLNRHLPKMMSTQVQSAIANAADSLGFKHLYLESGAGHDAQSMAEICSAGMLFVPSVGGTSHSPREFTKWKDCLNGVNVLLQACLNLAYQYK